LPFLLTTKPSRAQRILFENARIRNGPVERFISEFLNTAVNSAAFDSRDDFGNVVTTLTCTCLCLVTSVYVRSGLYLGANLRY
jgi:hypothetical protein